jgi:hypothetical protein
MKTHKPDRTEKTLTTIITTPEDYDEDIQETLWEEKENKILYTTILISTIIYLLTIISW